MIVALTGASGFLGSAVAKRLHEQGHRVVALVRSPNRQEALRPFVERFVLGDHADPSVWKELLADVDAVVHNSIDFDALRRRDWETHYETNVLGSCRLIHAAHEQKVGRFVFVSSVAVYHHMLPDWEGGITEAHPARPGSIYGAYKAAIESHLFAAQQQFGMETVILRPSAIYGVDHANLERTHAYKLVRRIYEGGTVTPEEFPGGGKFVHRDDTAAGIVAGVERAEAANRVFVLSDQLYAKYTQFAAYAAEALGLPADRVVPNTEPPAKRMFDNRAARNVLGVELNRGEASLRGFVRELLAAMERQDASCKG